MLKGTTFFSDNGYLSLGWVGSTLFTGTAILEQLVNQINFLTIAGWIITSTLTIVASVYKIIHTRAEIRKSNAIAEKIEEEVEDYHDDHDKENIKDMQSLCMTDMCKYKLFYDDFSPIIISRLEKDS